MTQLYSRPPHVIYKLRGVRSFWRDLHCLLVARQAFLGKPSSFNDPYEFLPKISIPDFSRRQTWINREVRERPAGSSAREVRRRCEILCVSPVHRQEYLEGLRGEDLDRYGVVSLSSPIECPVLWAHYADDHRGFAVGYRGQDSEQGEAFPAFPVQYRKRRPSLYPFGPEPDWLSILRTKSPAWKYEGEWRYVRPPDEGGPGLMDVPPGAIVEVRLGLRISNWHAGRVIATARRLPDKPRILRARLHPDTFALDFEDVD